MSPLELRRSPFCRTRANRGKLLFSWVLFLLAGLVAVSAAEKTEQRANAADDSADAADDGVVSLAAYNVKADRIEDFGLRVGDPGFVFTVFVPRPQAPFIEAVLPNTAASKVGLQPGDRILKSDGRSAAMTVFSADKWRKFMAAKNAEAASGRTVKWTLEIKPRGTEEIRTVTLTLPTPPPRWGSSVWHAPEGRQPATVAEPGPLAERSRVILDHGIWTSVEARFLAAPPPSSTNPWPTGYQWAIGGVADGGIHIMTVTQVSDRTEVLLETGSRMTSRWVYRTTPSGALEKAWHFTRKFKGEVPIETARAGFEHELVLWATKIGKVSPRWPLELKPGYDANGIFALLAAKNGAAPATPARRVAEDFLKLPAANQA